MKNHENLKKSSFLTNFLFRKALTEEIGVKNEAVADLKEDKKENQKAFDPRFPG